MRKTIQIKTSWKGNRNNKIPKYTTPTDNNLNCYNYAFIKNLSKTHCNIGQRLRNSNAMYYTCFVSMSHK